jgi:hypothetical protein
MEDTEQNGGVEMVQWRASQLIHESRNAEGGVPKVCLCDGKVWLFFHTKIGMVLLEKA